MTHAWCSDPSRDAAVRAAEDGRDRPLPTLEEAIASPFAEAAERSSTVSENGEGQSEMRTERVTLEFEVERGSPPSEWPWSYILSRSDALKMRPGESVRVVEEEERQAPPMTKTATTENDYVPPAPVSRPAETRQTQAERVGGGWWFPKYDKPSAPPPPPPPPPPAPPRVHRGSGVFDASGDELPWEGVVAILTAERDAAIRERDEFRRALTVENDHALRIKAERDAAIRERESLREQLESVACRAATAETALAEIKLLDYDRAAVNGAAWQANKIAAKALEAASGGREPVAYFVKWADKDWGVQDQTFRTLERAQDYIKDEKSEDENPQIVPLYASPPQPRGWLSQDEWDFLDHHRHECAERASTFSNLRAVPWIKRVKLLDALLARSTPPEVVLPDNPYHPSGLREGFGHALRVIRNELVNAGVAVKEVQ